MRRPFHDSRERGSALLATLGLLAIASALIFAFALSARTERLAARQAKEGICASGHLDSALAIAMSRHLPLFLRWFDPDSGGIYLPFGDTGDFDRWSEVLPDSGKRFKPSIALSYDSRHGSGSITNCLWNDVTNYLPAALYPQLEDCTADWIPVEVVDENSDARDVLATNALLAYAVIDLSGFLDASTISTNQVRWLHECGTDISDVGEFIEDRARQTASGDDGLPAADGYVTYRDLVRRNRGLKAPPGYLFNYSLDVAPDVTSTGLVVYSSDDADEPGAGAYLPKYDLNSWTNGCPGDPNDTGDLESLAKRLEEHYKSPGFRDGWLHEVTKRLACCGFAASREIAWNLVNFMDGDRIPQGPDGVQWREDWPVEDVPLVNEIAVAQVPPGYGYTNSYAPAVELWYPFATNAITDKDDATLVMAVYTNWPPETSALSGPNWTNDIILLPGNDSHGFTVSNAIGEMCFGTSSEYLAFAVPPPYVSFPVTATNLSQTGDGPRYRPVTEGNWDQIEPRPGTETGTDENSRYLKATTFNLPIGIQAYSTYEQIDKAADIWKRSTVTVTNEIRLITRVMVQGRWVDEAMAYDPDPGSRYHTRHDGVEGPYPFREPCGFEVDDPRRNGRFDDWVRYTGGDEAPEPEGTDTETRYRCTLSGTTNSICNPWHEYGQGLPVVHYDAPLRRAGDIGYIHEPYSGRHYASGFSRPYDDKSVTTNAWQSICLADARIMNITNNYSFSAGSVLEFFTVRCATNTPVRGLVNASTPWPAVVGALAADIKAGTGINPARFDKNGVGWVTNVFFDVRRKIFESRSVPVGVGDFCMGAGLVDSYYSVDAIDEKDDSWHWRDSWGSDSKEDVLRELCERISFRQQIYGVYLVARSTTPAMTVGAERKALAIVLRDAYTGAWRILNWIDL